MKDYSKEPWWNGLTRKEKEEVLRLEGVEISKEMDTGDKQPTVETPSHKKHFKAIDLFGLG